MEEIENEQQEFASNEEKRSYSLRHSAAHIMAQAVMRLYPEAGLAIGPPIKDGFYYDIDIDTTLNEESLVAIEKEMKRIIKENQKFGEYKPCHSKPSIWTPGPDVIFINYTAVWIILISMFAAMWTLRASTIMPEIESWPFFRSAFMLLRLLQI